MCHCNQGYELLGDLTTCKATGPPVDLLMSDRSEIKRVMTEQGLYRSILKNLTNAIGLGKSLLVIVAFSDEVILSHKLLWVAAQASPKIIISTSDRCQTRVRSLLMSKSWLLYQLLLLLLSLLVLAVKIFSRALLLMVL